jgi:deoxyinosine 3'endonuclease (endonuclease V)
MHPTAAAVHTFSVSKAHKTQLHLSQKIITEDRLPEKVNRIADIDVAYTDELVIGAAHPYGCCFASHLGLAIGKPTVGVAKSRLFNEPKKIAGQEFLFQNDRVIGEVVTTKKGAKTVYVSAGHLISLGTAVKIGKKCVRNSRVPEPILQAHKIASEEKRKVQANRKTL